MPGTQTREQELPTGYAKFYKADLQMQTPVDRRHWRGPEKITPLSTSEERYAVALEYIRECYEVGLEVIGITEHNLCPEDSASLIPELEKAITDLESTFGYRIVLFPGFEISAPIGKGTHVLCLFEPGTPVAVLSDKLTRLGLAPHERFVEGKPEVIPGAANIGVDDLLRVIQEDVNYPGIVILAHATRDNGILDSKTIAQSWSSETIKDERFLCLEIPVPRDQATNMLHSILANTDSRYERSHPIASICSSDCKSIKDSGDGRNFIGSRHTWIRLQKPTIEGLRQAFLDHESRIKFGESSPNDSYVHPAIRSITIEDAKFLADQSIDLSPNLNVIIGGSGSGKSTIVNYLRKCLGQAASIRGEDVAKNLETSLSSMKPATTVRAELAVGNSSMTCISVGPTVGTVTSEVAGFNDQAPDLAFPVRFYGQREIYNIAEDREATISLIDDLNEVAISALRRLSEQALTQYRVDDRIARSVDVIRNEVLEVKARHATENARLQSLKMIREPAERVRDAAQLLRIAEDAITTARATGAAVREICDSPPSPTDSSDTNLAAFLSDLGRAQGQYLTEVKAASTKFEASVQGLEASAHITALRQAHANAALELHKVLDEAEGVEGFEQEEVDAALARIAGYENELRALSEKLLQVHNAMAAASTQLELLQSAWNDESSLRSKAAEGLGDAVPKTKNGDPFIEVAIHQHGDDRDFKALMSPYLSDRRRISDESWDALMTAVHAFAVPRNASTVLVELLDGIDNSVEPPTGLSSYAPVLTKLAAMIPASRRGDLQSTRVSDRAEVTLRRHDGSVAGTLESGLSVGQKCTAVLAMLLAMETVPLVIDQPEDEIDNEFIFRELVPLFRAVKEDRQVVIVTHDPNIPVNGDAELIYPLAAFAGRGAVKLIDGQPATGALDNPLVQRAVEEIMEGSEIAFRRRYVKYGF